MKTFKGDQTMMLSQVVSLLLLGLMPLSNQEDSLHARVLERIAERVENEFYDSDRAPQLAEQIRGWIRDESLSQISDPSQLASALNARLTRIDKHLMLSYTRVVVMTPEQAAAEKKKQNSPRRPGRPESANAYHSRINYGIRKVEILPGNVGYIDFRMFLPPEVMGDRFVSALSFLSDSDAIIFDLRRNTGGMAASVAFLMSHFVDPEQGQLLWTVRSRDGEQQQYYAQRYTAIPARPNVPIYLLTSEQTISAAESFAYHLQAMKRATVVGRRTAGGGNAGRGFRPIGDRFSLFVPCVWSVDPKTGKGVDANGVTPDIDVDSSMALQVALKHAYRSLLEQSPGQDQERALNWALELAASREAPSTLTPEKSQDYVGQYSGFEIRCNEDQMTMHLPTGSVHVLSCVGEDRFSGSDPWMRRLVFERDESGKVIGARREYDSPGLGVSRHLRND